MRKTAGLSPNRNNLSFIADRFLDKAKATEEAFEKAGFSENFPLSEKEKKLLFGFFHAFVKSTSFPIEFPPRHLMAAFDWLLTISQSNYPNVPNFLKGLEYPAKKILEAPTVLYFVESIAEKIRGQGLELHRPVIHWLYSDRKNRPLIDYNSGIGNYPLLNHWGVLNAVQALDECFSKCEADLLRTHLEKDKRLIETKITPAELPAAPLFSMGLGQEHRIELTEENGYKLPFKVTGVLEPGVWEMKENEPHKKSNKVDTLNL
jgi:hypothetical protein